MHLPLSLWYALRTGHVAHGVSADGEPVRVHARLDPDGRAGYVVARDGACPADAPSRSSAALSNHSAVFYEDGSLCDFLYANGLDPARLAIVGGAHTPASADATSTGPPAPPNHTLQTT